MRAGIEATRGGEKALEEVIERSLHATQKTDENQEQHSCHSTYLTENVFGFRFPESRATVALLDVVIEITDISATVLCRRRGCKETRSSRRVGGRGNQDGNPSRKFAPESRG